MLVDFTFAFMHRTEVVDFEAVNLVQGSHYAIHPAFIEILSLVPGSAPGGGGRPVAYLNWSLLEQAGGTDLL
jgi:hypothetical protein